MGLMCSRLPWLRIINLHHILTRRGCILITRALQSRALVIFSFNLFYLTPFSLIWHLSVYPTFHFFSLFICFKRGISFIYLFIFTFHSILFFSFICLDCFFVSFHYLFERGISFNFSISLCISLYLFFFIYLYILIFPFVLSHFTYSFIAREVWLAKGGTVSLGALLSLT